MKTPTFQFPPDRITQLMSHPGMPDMNFIVLVAPSEKPGVSYVSIINDAGRFWRFVKGPSAVHTSRIWQYVARLDPRWLKAPWAIHDAAAQFANPDAVLDRYAKTGTGTQPDLES